MFMFMKNFIHQANTADNIHYVSKKFPPLIFCRYSADVEKNANK